MAGLAEANIVNAGAVAAVMMTVDGALVTGVAPGAVPAAIARLSIRVFSRSALVTV